ncbi:response regulator transcription factor [Nocardia salmonicida]
MPKEADSPLDIAIVEDHAIWVRGLSAALAEFRVMATITHHRSVAEFLAASQPPQLVILDLQLGDSTTPANSIALLAAATHRVLVITSGERPDLVREAAHAGVLGVVCKSEPDAVIAEAVRTASRGEVVGSVDWAAAIDSDAAFVPNLSPREREVLSLWASGETAKGVAEMLNLSVNTVNVYLRRVKEKYEAVGNPARTKGELRAAAQQAGLVPKTWWGRAIRQHHGP